MRFVVHLPHRRVSTDDKPLRTLALKGDTRAALVPFLAHKYALFCDEVQHLTLRLEDMNRDHFCRNELLRALQAVSRGPKGGKLQVAFVWDDDTLYFTDAVLKVLSKLDHNMPYFVTGKTNPMCHVSNECPSCVGRCEYEQPQDELEAQLSRVKNLVTRKSTMNANEKAQWQMTACP